MDTRARRLVAAALGALWLLAVASGPALAQAPAALRLEDLERMALERNPTLPQARAQVRALQGRQTQAGLYPNPLVGYELEELTAREPGRHKNFFWFQVPIVTGGKLGLSRELAAAEVRLGETGVEAQRLRVLTTVRMLYWEALGAARLVAIQEELLAIVGEAATVSEELANVGQADRPDVLEIEIQRERATLDLGRARSHQARIWRTLAAAVGDPGLPLAPLAGDLESPAPPVDPEAATARLLRESPEVRRAQLAVERARTALERVRAERVPNLFVRTRLGYSSESAGSGRDVGFEAGVELGLPLPIFDRQQGNLTAAEADLEHAREEVRRLELELRTQLAAVLKSYEDARATVARYREEILPRAQRSHDLFLGSFRQMAAAYPQVLIARRSLALARVEHVQALIEQWRAAALVEGLQLGGGLETPRHSLVQLPPPTGHIPASSGRPAD